MPTIVGIFTFMINSMLSCVKLEQELTLLWNCIACTHLQSVNNNYAKFEYEGMKSV